MTQSESSPSIVETWTEDPLAALTAAAIGVLVGAGVTLGILYVTSSGDEPPIRVRNGSIQLEVGASTWKQTGNVWKISGGAKQVDSYWLYLAPTNPAACQSPKINGNGIVFGLNDGTQVRVESKNRKTEVTSTRPLTLSADKKTLSYGGGDVYITEIRLDGASGSQCTFASKDTNLHTLLIE